MTGRKLGNYEVLDKLGEGGMGEVWRARDARLNRSVAVKVLPADMAGDPSRRQRFEQEARALGTLNHPNIVAIYDVGQSEGQSYIVSELVEGESLRAVIDRGPLPSRKLLDIATETADALAAAHSLGIIHRDLKPENIMISAPVGGSPGRVKVLDFGLAKQSAPQPDGDNTATLMLSQPGMVLGTVGYMSPEQVRAEPVDARSDIFSFGCVLYEMATGKKAFQGKTSADVISAVLKEEPPEFTIAGTPVPPALETIVRRCLEKDPTQRFHSAADLAFALRSISQSSSISQVSQALARPARKMPGWLIPALAAPVLFAAGYLLHTRPSGEGIPQFHRITFREGSISSARFSPDWKAVLYSASWDADQGRIYLANPGNPESRDLDLPGTRLLSVSSKGDLAFLQGPFTPDGFGTLARNSISGGQTRQLLEKVLLADWSPDGMELAVVRAADGKFRLEYPIGKVLNESPWVPFNIRVSPDGQLVAFTTFAAGPRISLSVVDRNAKVRDLGTISNQTAEVHGSPLSWTPDGKEIWFRSYDSNDADTIHAISLSGRNRVVTRFPGQADLYDIAADGRLLLSTQSGRRGIRGVAPGESMERDLSCLDASTLKGISSDGRSIVADVLGESGGPKGSIYLRSTSGTPPVRLGNGVAYALSPDGKVVAGYSSRDIALRKFELMPTGPGETVESKLVLGWLAGERNYLVAQPVSNNRLQFFAWNAANNQMNAITPADMPDANELPLVSPDGKQFLAMAADKDHYVYSIDGREPKRVAGMTPHDLPVAWRADGRAIFVTTHHDTNKTILVSTIDLDKGQRAIFKEIQPSIPVDEAGNLRITPDGKAYAYNYTYVRSELFVAEGIR